MNSCDGFLHISLVLNVCHKTDVIVDSSLELQKCGFEEGLFTRLEALTLSEINLFDVYC